jgi:hypothetical protein
MMIGQPCPLHPALAIQGACDRCGDFGCPECIPTGRSCTRCVPNWAVPKPDISKAVTEVFQDPAWGWKVASGGLCMLLGIFLLPTFILLGYHLRIARRQREAPGAGLPEWDELGSLCWNGFKGYVCFMLPLVFVYAAIVTAFVGVMFATGGFAAKSSGPPPPVAIFMIIGMELGIIAFFFAYGALVPAIQIEHLRTGSVLAAFHVRALWRIIAGHPVDYVFFALIAFALYFVSTLVGEMLCLVGMFFTMPIGLYVEGHYLGRYAAWLDSVDATG